MIYAMNEETLRAEGTLLLENIQDGFRNCCHMIISGTRRDLLCFLKCCMQENGGHAYADFYYPVLKPDEQQRFRAGLSEKENSVLENLETDSGLVYYPLTEENLEFLYEVTARNWLFSTFYFVEKQAVVWGNYDLRYPVFCRNTEDLEYYRKLAEKCRLEILE